MSLETDVNICHRSPYPPAVEAFQAAQGLGVDGIAENQTWPHLVIQVAAGSIGEAVRALQSQIHSRGDRSVIAIDGDFGQMTSDAVGGLQQFLGLTGDHIVGPVTWNHFVNGYLNAARSSGSEWRTPWSRPSTPPTRPSSHSPGDLRGDPPADERRLVRWRTTDAGHISGLRRHAMADVCGAGASSSGRTSRRPRLRTRLLATGVGLVPLAIFAPSAMAAKNVNFVGTWKVRSGAGFTISKENRKTGACVGRSSLVGYKLVSCKVRGNKYTFTITYGPSYRSRNTGTISGKTLKGTFKDTNGTVRSYTAKRH